MNHKKRGAPFAQQRMEVWTDSNTFFSSVKSICSFCFFLFFFHFLTQFLWIANLQRGNDNHGAYQNYIREVGTPNIFLTNKAKSQSVNKWSKTSQKNQTQQIMLVPDKQNHNTSELNINDVKTCSSPRQTFFYSRSCFSALQNCALLFSIIF